MDYEILPLSKEEFQGVELVFEYETSQYYDAELSQSTNGFSAIFTKKTLDSILNKKFTDTLFQPYWEGSEAFGIFDGDSLIACLEIWKEEWSNRLRVTELNIIPGYRRKGLGKAMMDFAKNKAIAKGCRALILETQSCNENAILFYLSQGLTFFGFDRSCYSNSDVEKKEVRLELGIYLDVLVNTL